MSTPQMRPPWLPQDKLDVTAAEAAVQTDWEQLQPWISELFQWTQDSNWPVAQVLIPFFLQNGSRILPEIRRVLTGSDENWQEVVLTEIVESLPSELIAALKPELAVLMLRCQNPDLKSQAFRLRDR